MNRLKVNRQKVDRLNTFIASAFDLQPKDLIRYRYVRLKKCAAFTA
jgi:hypothetical protein